MIKRFINKSIKVVKLTINDNAGKPFHRIDGNHRLNAAEISKSEKLKEWLFHFVYY